MNRIKVSEPHNFGQSVFLDTNGFVQKPRPLIWEWILYSQNSFRTLLDDLGVTSAFPILSFDGNLLEQGHVEKLVLDARFDPIKHSKSVGEAIAIYAFLGTGDLHKDNILYGTDRNGNFRFCSIDVENILGDFSDAGQTSLLLTSEIPQHICGLSELLPRGDARSLNPSLMMCSAYIATLNKLLENESVIWHRFSQCLGNARPAIRVVARKTMSYVNFLRSKRRPTHPESEFTMSELIQLRRQDVPYYFRRPDSREIFFWHAIGEQSDVTDELSSQFRFPASRCLTNHMDDRLNGTALLKRGALQILRNFVPSTIRNEETADEVCRIRISSDRIHLSTDKFKVSCDPLKFNRA